MIKARELILHWVEQVKQMKEADAKSVTLTLGLFEDLVTVTHSLMKENERLTGKKHLDN